MVADGRERILVDTNVIIESHRTGCFGAISGRYKLESSDTCLAETQRGRGSKSSYIEISKDELMKKLVIHSLTEMEKVEVALTPGFAELDDGERDLVALLVFRKEECRICSPDKAALRLLNEYELLDRLVSLEELAQKSGARPKLKENYTRRWQSEWSTKLKLGVMV